MTEPTSFDPHDTERFRRARAIFETVSGRSPVEAADLITRACGGDAALAAEVERMLRADAAAPGWLDGSIWPAASRLAPGDIVGGHLRIVALIGRGGMGEVYRAHDTTLGRDVAVKVLPPAMADTAAHHDRVARFMREAQVLASVNHPNIAAIHGLEMSDGVHALILELVEGPTLAECIAAGPIAVDEAVAAARQIAEALEAAHERGVVHRDLKPANIKLRPDGTVKLLDFGLAKMREPEDPSGNIAPASSTLTHPSLLQRGMVLGTPAYLSPEQARGEEAGRRSDIWAFGAVLYEMLTRERAFGGQTVSDTIAAVLRQEINWAAVDTSTPDALRRLISRCLDRDIRRRLRDIGEARIALEDLAATRVSPAAPSRLPPPIPRPRWRRILIPAVAAGISGVAAAAMVWDRGPAAIARVTRFSLDTTAATALFVDPQSRDLAVTADGAHVVYKGGSRGESTQLFVRRLDRLEASALTAPGLPKSPFSSPDGQWVGFFDRGVELVLKKVAIAGGPALEVARIADGPSRGATWGEDGNIIVATASPETGLQQVPASGGAPRVLTRPDRSHGEGDHLWPHYLPGARTVLFTITAVSGGLEAAQIAALDLETGTWKTVMRGASQAQYLASGHLVYLAGEALWVVPFDLDRLEPTGTARVIVPQVLILPSSTAEFDVARDGTLVYVAGGAATPRRRLVWVDRRGGEEEVKAMPPRPYSAARLSPDGSRVAVQIDDADRDIWVWDLAREMLTRVTTDPGPDQSPLWTPDGRALIFTSQAGGVLGALFRQAADGTGVAERLSDGPAIRRATAFVPDGSAVLFNDDADIMMLTMGREHRTQPVIQTSQLEQDGVISPDGRWLAYAGFDSGSSQVFVRPFPNVNDSRTQISTAGGGQPLWSRNGRDLFYMAPDGTLMSAAVRPDATWQSQPPVPVVDGRILGNVSVSLRVFDVSPDGRRFLMITDAPGRELEAGAPRIVVVQNWLQESRRLQ
jgi:serine/threonine-protein kinase